MNLSDLRSRLRLDLRDTDPATQRWSDAELDRHIDRAVREFSLAIPDEDTADLTTTAGSREVSIAGLQDLVAVEAVEYPVDREPREYVRFSRWADTLTLSTDTVPAGAEPVRVRYTRLHTIDANGSTIPPRFEDVVATGAAAYAALEWAAFAVNRVNTGGAEAWRHFQAWGHERLAAFHRELARHARRNAVRTRRLRLPDPAEA